MKVPIVLLACVVALAVAASPAKRGWCATRTSFPKHGRDGGCTNHACDAPATRDGYLVNSTTEWLTVRLALHVLATDEGNLFVTEEAIRNILTVAGDTFAPAKIRFVTSVRVINDTNLVLNTQFHTVGADLMQNLAAYSINPTKVLNVFVGVLTFPRVESTLLGVGTLPWDAAAQTASGVLFLTVDGTVVDKHTLAHELGHMFGLWHTHHGVSEIEPECGPCSELAKHPADDVGDLCADTPPTPLNMKCARPDTHMGDIDSFDCEGNNWGRTHLENVMGYSNCTAVRTFTPQQMARMRCYLTEKLAGWLAPACVNASDCAAADTCSIDQCVEGVCAMKALECPQASGHCKRTVCSEGQCVPQTVNCTIAAPGTCAKGSCSQVDGTKCTWNTASCPTKSCCTVSGAPLCTDNIQALMCTCAVMPACCSNAWDETCMAYAKQYCSLTCTPSQATAGGCLEPAPTTLSVSNTLTLDTTSTSFTHKFFLAPGTGVMRLDLCTRDPRLTLSVRLHEGCNPSNWEKVFPPSGILDEKCNTMQFWPLGARTILEIGTPVHRGIFTIKYSVVNGCSTDSHCLTDKCHVPVCGSNGQCVNQALPCEADPGSGLTPVCFREDGCKMWNENRVPAGWTCLKWKFNDSHCDCNCGAPDADCAKGEPADACEVWQKCDTGLCTNRAPAGWTCSPQVYDDSVCDCGCGAKDPDCASTRIVRNCAANQVCEDSICKDMPAGWKCDPSYYGTGDGCDCECGAPDPDCELSDMPAVGCKAGHPCTPKGTCTLGPWNCSSANYDADDGCHCLCGSQDPDCLKSGQAVVGCPVPRSICTADAECIPVSDLPSSQIPSEYWSIPPASSVLPASAAGHALVSTAALLFAMFVALF